MISTWTALVRKIHFECSPLPRLLHLIVCLCLGACEGTMACVTCHLIFSENDFNKLAEPATEDELDMLDMAIGLSDTLVNHPIPCAIID